MKKATESECNKMSRYINVQTKNALVSEKKTKRTYNNDSYWTESEYKRMDFFFKKNSFEPVGKMD